MDISAALLMGAVLGLERHYGGHPAGLRTNALVSVGAALFVSLSARYAGNPAVEPTRMASYIIAGIGFLGGGVIMRDGFAVHGLNTAATLWCSAAVGTLCGAGFVHYAAVGAACVLVAHIGLQPLSRWVDAKRKTATNVETAYRVRVVCEDREQVAIRTILIRYVNAMPKMTVHGVATQESDQPGRVAVVADIFSCERGDHALDDMVGRLQIEPGVTSVKWEAKQQALSGER